MATLTDRNHAAARATDAAVRRNLAARRLDAAMRGVDWSDWLADAPGFDTVTDEEGQAR